MKSKQSYFEQIIRVSIKKVQQKSVGGAKSQFQLRLKELPTKIKQLNADPYMFIFEALISFPEEVDFTLTQYHSMINQNFLNPNNHSQILTKHFRLNLANHSFRITQIMIDIKEPNIDFLKLFFDIHDGIKMAENVLENFRYNGYRWLSRTFAFKQIPYPSYINELTSGILKTENRNLPSQEDEDRSISNYIQRILHHMTFTIQNSLKPENQKLQSKFGVCFNCFKPADYYCKDTKVSICSSDCKKAHINYINNNPAIDFQYHDKFKFEVEELLILNLKQKKNVPLSIDFLCAIYMNSQYIPKSPLPHRQLLLSPVIIERIWLLYSVYYLKRNETFEHIFAECLKSKVDYLHINSAKYFLKIIESTKILDIYKYLDFHGFRRIFPVILKNMHDQDYKMKFITCIIDRIFEETRVSRKICQTLQKQSTKISSFIRAINHVKNPLTKFVEVYGEQHSIREMMRFIIKNQQQINKGKICELVLANDQYTRIFLQELLLDGDYLKVSPYLDEILREILYFINIKISDKIYRLLEILCEVLDFNKLKIAGQWQSQHLSQVFSQEHTSSPDTMFTFAYFLIMIVTELNNPQNTKKITQQQYLNRVKSFDQKFSTNMRQYVLAIYHRLVEMPFSQESRGLLSRYETVTNKGKLGGPTFYPLTILLDNWEIIYETIESVKVSGNLLYRCCQNLINCPNLCQPFLQLLLNKLIDGSAQAMTVSLKRIKQQQNILVFINNIIKQEPNCVGTTSWKYLFLKTPEVGQNPNTYLFQLSTLIHSSKLLNFSNFIWFVRQFCRHVKLSQNFAQCIDLLEYHIKASGSNEHSEQKQKIQILNKQFVELFRFERNIYYQLELLKSVFQMRDYQLAVILLDIVQVNVVSQTLIVAALMDIVEKEWFNIQAMCSRELSKSRDKQTDEQQKIVVSLQDSPTYNKIWNHIITKIHTICLNTPHLLQDFSTLLQSIPELQRQFQRLNIEYAVQSAFLGRQFCIDEQLRKKLYKFEQHITQMYQSYQTLAQMCDKENENKNKTRGLLQQFIYRQNIKEITRNFKYFWQREGVYQLLTEDIILNWSLKESKQVTYAYLSSDFCRNQTQILKILKQNSYIQIIKTSNRYESVLGYISSTTLLLELVSSPNSDQNNQMERKNIEETLKTFKIELWEIVKLVTQKLKAIILDFQQQQKGLISQVQSQQFQYFVHVSNLLYSFLNPIYVLLSNQKQSVIKTLSPQYGIFDIFQILQTINNNYQYRMKMHGKRSILQMQSEKSMKHNLLPGFLHEQHLAQMVCVLFEKAGNKQPPHGFFCNAENLQSVLQVYLTTFRGLISEERQKKNNGKRKGKEEQKNSSTKKQKQENSVQSPSLLNLYKQKIRFSKKSLQIICSQLQKRECPQIAKKDAEQIKKVLVQLMQQGFDFYDPERGKLELGQKNPQIYTLYKTFTRLSQTNPPQ